MASAVPWYTQGFHSRTGIEVKVEISKDFLRLSPDAEVTLFRVIQESLTNVHRYSGSSTASIRVEAVGGEVMLEIRDWGRGIQSKNLNAPTDTVAGLGVGIQGMRERMRQLGGTLEIESKHNQGTAVKATLPLVQATPGPPEPVPNGAPATLRKRILIADDHEALRHGVRQVLQTEPDWDVCGEASDGRQAVEKALTLNPDLVIVDINMPVIDGLETARQIIRDRPHIKVLVFTVHDSEQTMREIVAAGAHGYLSKAKSGRDLVDVVKTLLAGNTSYPRS